MCLIGILYKYLCFVIDNSYWKKQLEYCLMFTKKFKLIENVCKLLKVNTVH